MYEPISTNNLMSPLWQLTDISLLLTPHVMCQYPQFPNIFMQSKHYSIEKHILPISEYESGSGLS